MSNEIIGGAFLVQLRQARDTGDRDAARNALTAIQKCVHGPSRCALDPVPEAAIDDCMGKGSGNIPITVATGTCGERIYVHPEGRLTMAEDEQYGADCRARFAQLFGGNLDVSFV